MAEMNERWVKLTGKDSSEPKTCKEEQGFGVGRCQRGEVLMKGFAGEMVKMLDCGGQGTAAKRRTTEASGGKTKRMRQAVSVQRRE